MSENKYCGNCRYFTNEDANGYGWCSRFLTRTRCGSGICREYEMPNNGWTEITPDNVEELYESKERVCVAFMCNGEVSYMCGQFGMTLSTMAKYGGYYYYVLPELKLEERL